MTKHLNWIVAGFAVLLSVVHAAAAGPAKDTDTWYVLDMDGQRAGYMHATRQTADGVITSTTSMRMEIKRGPVEIAVVVETRFEETEDGTPIMMATSTDMGGMGANATRYVFTEDGVEITRSVAGMEQKETAALPEGEWLTPAAAARHAAEAIARGETEVTITTLDPSSGLTPITSTRKGLEPTTVEVFGKSVPARRAVTTVSMLPGIETIEFIDDAGEMIRSELNMGMFTLTTLLADEALALSALDAPELMQSTFITPDKAITGARTSRVGRFIARVDDGDMIDLDTAGVQTFERLDGQRGRVVVDLGATPTGLIEGETAADYLGATPMLQSDDERVSGLAERLAGDEADAAKIAERLRRGVYRYMTRKGLGVGFASALECVQTREGDCTEHGVLLAALLRARGIPSRVVSGIIYADSFAGSENIFGYHMWTQALLPDADGTPRWVDLDATLPGVTPFDATHIALGTDALDGDGQFNALVKLAPMIGRLKIEVESVE